MIVTIIQPAYIPWLGFFERVHLSDLYVVLDHVQLDTNSKTNFTNRNKIRTPQASSWLTVPIRKKGKFGSLFINELEIDNDSGWAAKHWATIKQFYSKAPHFSHHADFFQSLYNDDYLLLVDLINKTNDYLFKALGIDAKIIYSSKMNIGSKKNDLILEICKQTNANTYISGPFGKDYIDKDAFASNNIDLIFHDYNHPTYTQRFPGFVPYMSVIDLLFNYGNESLKILNTAKSVNGF